MLYNQMFKLAFSLLLVISLPSLINAQTRTITFINDCANTLYFEAVPGAIPNSPHCTNNGNCPQGTYCDTNNNLCFWVTPNPSAGWSIPPNGGSTSISFPYYNNGQSFAWSGAFGGCVSGTCGASASQCSSSGCGTGAGNPMTRAEFTLTWSGSDFYDVEVINGYNLPVAIYPQSSFTDPSDAYFCGSPGSPHALTGTANCNWQFNPPSVSYNWVSAGGNGCSSNSDCSGGNVCGLSFNPGQNPLLRLTCGNLFGYWTGDQVCGIDPNFGAPFNCNLQPGGPNPGFTLTELYACSNGIASCYQPNAPQSCCGCKNWNSLGLTIPSSTTQCYNSNPNWLNYVEPTLAFLKQACPSLYTYPYDDMSSTFTCHQNNAAGQNVANYQVVWCPLGTSGPSQTPTPSSPTPSNPVPVPSTPSSNGIQWNPGNGWAWANGCDFTGNDLTSAQVPASQCGPTCQNTGGCTHYAWTPPSNCWMKQNGASESDAKASSTNGIVCGVQLSTPTPPAPTPTPTPPPASNNGVSWNCDGGWCWGFNCDWAGNDMSSTQADGSACGPICSSTSGCTHFSWTPPSNCWLKTNSVSQNNAISSSTNGIVCGFRQ